MNVIERDGTRIAYRISGPAMGPPILFAHSLGLDSRSWEAEATALATRHLVVRIDTRGHGGSAASPGPYSLRDLCLDHLAVADALGLRQFHVVGISLGGLLAQWLATQHPTRLLSATLCNTAAKLGDETLWNNRIEAVSAGMDAIVDQVLPRLFAPGFAQRQPARVAQARQTLLATDPEGYAGCCAALRDADLRTLASTIQVPTLIVGAAHDRATPVAEARWLHEQIPSSELVILEQAGHISNLERPAAFLTALSRHLSRHQPSRIADPGSRQEHGTVRHPTNVSEI